MRAQGAYYNENDTFAAQWLRNLIAAGHIADGEVDERSIVDVEPSEIKNFTQCHFFAGIAVWSHALRSAGWPDDRPVWTGSCPCQPFSAAGKGEGFNDPRHLWPTWNALIRECRPATVFGEQVASKDGLGWFDLVQTDMEASDYAVGAADLCAAGFGAPHWRQRLWFVAERVAHPQSVRLQKLEQQYRDVPKALRPEKGNRGGSSESDLCGLAHPNSDRCEAGQSATTTSRHRGAFEPEGGADRYRPAMPTDGFWRDADWLFCRDGKWRPVEPGTFPLAHGITARVGRLRAYGNAIVAQVAQGFIESYMECE